MTVNFSGGDPETEMVFQLLPGQGDDAVRELRRHPFEEDEQAGPERAEITPKDMAVGGVDNDRDAGRLGRPTTQDTRLGGVGMAEGGTEAKQEGAELKKGLQIAQRVDLPHQGRDGDDLHTPLGQDGEIIYHPLPLLARRVGGATEEELSVPLGVQVPEGEKGVLRRSPLVEAGDDMRDPDSIQRCFHARPQRQ